MGIINDIADQTKMIAFNAAIEAASSGEAGKRFGVVAVEIRRLADNVMESTGEIENKIEEIQKSINRLVVASESGSKVITRIAGSHAYPGRIDGYRGRGKIGLRLCDADIALHAAAKKPHPTKF